ncbi:MAG: methyltransferase domain-containing protein [Brevinema sp.]
MITKRNLSVLFIVQSGKKYGIGHLKRALTISNYYNDPFVWVLTDLKETSSLEKLLKDIPYEISNMNDNLEQKNVVTRKYFDLMITDCDYVNSKFIDVLNNLNIPMISLDNANLGKCSEVFIAPLPSRKIKNANFKELFQTPIKEEYFELQENSNPRNILISLGGSDPFNNTGKIIRALKDQHYSLTVITGALNNYSFQEEDAHMTVLHDVESLLPYIQENDIIICGPGSTLLEAMASNKKIIAVAHTWNQALDLQAIPGLKILFGIFVTTKQIRNAVEDTQAIKLPKPDDFHFADWWLDISDNIANRSAFCPLCGSHNKTASLRTDEDNRFKCNNCNSSYAYSLHKPKEAIDSDSIIGSNNEQLQQSYKIAVLEQKEDSHRRIKLIKQLLPTPSYHSFYKLLDIGANHGIFVQEACHNGFNAQGVELASFARRIALDNNIQIFDSMETLYATEPIYHIITIWDKLHLLPDPLSYIKKISNMLAVGGMVAFRLPIEESHAFSKGFFRASLKGGELLAKRSGLILVHTTKFIDKKEYIEFYCIKKGSM